MIEKIARIKERYDIGIAVDKKITFEDICHILGAIGMFLAGILLVSSSVLLALNFAIPSSCLCLIRKK